MESLNFVLDPHSLLSFLLEEQNDNVDLGAYHRVGEYALPLGNAFYILFYV